MKKSYRFLHTCLPFILLIAFVPDANGQLLKKIKKSAERAAERTVERKVERETEKKMDAALDSILEPGSAGTEDQEIPAPKTDIPSDPKPQGDDTASGDTAGTSGDAAGSESMKIYTNYDFVAGDRLLLYEDFSVDNIGDFPAKWNTNGSGEVVTINESPDKWLKLSDRTVYVPDLLEVLPEDYTLEFDMITTGLDDKISSVARLQLVLDDNNSLYQGTNYAELGIPLAQYTDAGIRVNNYFNGKNTVNNGIMKDVRNDVRKRAHVAIAVNGERFRMWMNERKLVDLPRFIVTGLPKYIKFDLNGMPSEELSQFVFITNVKLAEGGEDLRSKLLKEGRFSTTGILFDPGSDKIKPESYGTLKKIAAALKSESGMNINIVGHTDSDGSDETNLELSKKRATSVKNALVAEFGVSSTRIQSDGKGESDPVSDNSTTEGKAQNRRVEFIKI